MNKIDLTPLVGSQILCEFWDYTEGDGFTGFLLSIEPTGRFRSHTDDGWLNCRIYHHSDYWISNADGKLVLPSGLQVVFMTRWGVDLTGVTTGDEISYLEGITPSCLPLEHDKNVSIIDIIAVQVIGPADGWSYD